MCCRRTREKCQKETVELLDDEMSYEDLHTYIIHTEIIVLSKSKYHVAFSLELYNSFCESIIVKVKE